MHSHHSHSGQYVQHAKDSLDEVVQEAIDCKLEVFCLTEHMPRIDSDHIYPEELATNTTVESLAKVFDDYYHHAKRLQQEVKGVKLLVGTEVEYIDDRYYPLIASLRKQYEFDMVVGSIHHVETIPIDYDLGAWVKARDLVGSSSGLFHNYFDSQYQMLLQVKPDVVAHFDLIKLFAKSDECTVNFEDLSKEPEIWAKVERNIDFINSYGGLIEVNSAALRKGMKTPYPSREIAQSILARGGKFCLSDDSHGTAQVALNYHRTIDYLETLGVQDVYYLDLEHGKTVQKSIPLSKLKSEWKGPVKST